MVALPLALSATYEPQDEPGDYAHVVVHLNGRPLLRIVSGDALAYSHHREQRAIYNALGDLARRTFKDDPEVEVFLI